MTLFSLSDFFHFVAAVILQTLPNILQKKLYVLTISDRYSKTTRAIFVLKARLAHEANLLVEY